MRTILIVGGYAGFYTAWKLRKMLCRGEARVEAAVAIRDRLLTAFDQAAGLPRGPDAGGAGDDAAVSRAALLAGARPAADALRS